MAEQTLKEKTAKGLFWGGISNGVQQVLGVLIGIILLKNLTEDDYGLVGMLAIFIAIASTIQESGFIAALTNRPVFKDNDYNAVFWFNLIVGSSIYVILYFCAPLIAEFYREPALIPLSRVLFLSIVVGSLGIAHNAVLFKKLMVKERAKVDIFATAISGVIGIYMVLNGYGYWALAIQTLAASTLGTLFRWYFSPWRPGFSIDFTPVKEMFGFSFKMLVSSIVSQVQINIFSVLLGKFYTKAYVGFYSQGTKWAGMGTQVINGMIYSVAQPVFVQVQSEKERQSHMLRKMIRFISFISFPALLGLAFISRDFITVINSNFLPAVPILQMYCMWGCVYLFSSLYIQIIIAHGRSNFYFWCTLVSSIIQIAVTFLACPYGLYWIAMANLIVSFLILLIWHISVSKLIPLSFFNFLKDTVPYLLIVFVCIVIAWLITKQIENLYIKLIAKVLLVAVFYVAAMWFSSAVIFREVLSFLLKKKQ